MEKFTLKIGEKDLTVEINDLAEQASGSCIIQYGDTVVLATAVISEIQKDGLDYFPLSVNYEEKNYAAGKILGSRYMRREGRPSDEAVIVSRLIDRAIRPLFPKGFKKEVQIIITCLSWDKENDADVIGLLAASVALLVSDIPWLGPVAPLRIGQVDGKTILNPTYEQREQSVFDLAISAVFNQNKLEFNMIEAEAKEADEKIMLEALKSAQPEFEKIIEFQNKIAQKVGKTKQEFIAKTISEGVEKDIRNLLTDKLSKTIEIQDRREREDGLKKIEEEMLEIANKELPEQDNNGTVENFLEDFTDELFHEKILQDKRLDNRKMDEIRKISVKDGLFSRTHGSGLFCRGKTKALSILTLGAPGDVRLLDGMEVSGEKRYMHHYNFPPYCVGEVRPIRGPGRREIGHGMLAEKALKPVMPSQENFPYTIRVVTEILSSNGSSSMAATCGSTIALMDAGVPIKAPVAGISLGLARKGNDFKILTDIQGLEDHFGDMDLKITGTEKGITAVQMDIKIRGISLEILEQGFKQGQKARLEILKEIQKVIPEPRKNLSPFAPRILTIKIDPEKIGDVIGKGGKIINEITQTCNVTIDIEEDGQIFVTAESEKDAQKAMDWIETLTKEIEVGQEFEGTVVKILDFGAFVELLPGKDGMIHISKLSDKRIDKVTDVINIGDKVQVQVISVDEQGRINLKLKSIVKKS
ncbi:MAG: polyribonucleotide nucleotidyltransferase [Patescibacteria group bacterium]